ncbi:MAG: helicase-exonuclease AddAB subunit AddA [Candidatus Improbicoccus devescovinae]|nr:MAG: helicase-exonuclease AddAB subunit AddA [Candidatus Improbicoccus devescovinae]
MLKLITGTNPTDLDKLLIVTFTKAAAREMKHRISDRISKELEVNIYDQNLRRQKYLLNSSFIGTIDSFCNNFIKENFEKCNISPNFRIIEDLEMSVIIKKAMNCTLDKIYSKISKENYSKVIEFFSDEKSDKKFIETIIKLYKFSRHFPSDEDFFKISLTTYQEILESSSRDFDKTLCGEILNKFIDENFNFLLNYIKIAINLSLKDAKINEKYTKVLEQDFNYLENLHKNKLYKIIPEFSFTRIPILKNVDENLKEKILFARSEAKKILENLRKYIFDFDIIKSNSLELLDIINSILEILRIFIFEINKIKHQKSTYDFTDLERFTLNILRNKDGKKSEIAKKYSQNFEEIMIDEYQDINFIQDNIFNLLSKCTKNLFIVGDSKQSIYSFRHAEPKIFLKYQEESQKIILDKNFRSQEDIINAINFIFKNLITTQTCGIDYEAGHELKFGAEINNSKNFFNVKIIQDKSENPDSSDILEAKHITNMIKNMKNLDNSNKIKYNDFCILLRNANKRAINYTDIFTKNGIPIETKIYVEFFKIEEIEILVSILKIINNPLQDIPLLCIIMSPIFGFNLEEITKIRALEPKKYIYFALKKAHESSEINSEIELKKKLTNFFNKIENYRMKSTYMPAEKLINFIIHDTYLVEISIIISKNKKTDENLKNFCMLASKYTDANSQNFSSFMNFLQKLETEENNFNEISTNRTQDAVKLMSIHKSKGLEFPICILAGCSHEFLKEYDDLIFKSKFGIGLKLKNENGTAKFQNATRRACEILLKNDKISEEIRLFYVAMTRAKNGLILFITVKNLQKKIEKIIKISNIHKEINSIDDNSNFYLKKSVNFSEWILYLYIKKMDVTNFDDFIINSKNNNEIEILESHEFYSFSQLEEFNKKKQNPDSEMYDFHKEILRRFDFKYFNSKKTMTPLKITATELASKEFKQRYAATSEPDFIKKNAFYAEEIGTAIHEFLSFSDYNLVLENYANHLNFLYKSGFILEKNYKILEQSSSESKIINFLLSPLGERLRKSEKIHREYRFTILKNLAKDHENTAIQGSIDCVFKEKDYFIIIDYKTDNVMNLGELVDRYLSQLQIYKIAFEKCEGVAVKELIIYSMRLNKYISINKKYLKI